jgi:hypothetical protein
MAYKPRDECIQQHISSCRERHELEKELVQKMGEEEFNSFFAEYETLGIKPTQVFKKLSQHKIAAETLDKCIKNLEE